MIRRWMVIIMLGLVMSACGKIQGQDPLAETNWELVSLRGAQVMEGYVPTLQFADGSVSGTTGCNEYSATYKVKGDQLTLDTIIWTERACMDQKAVGQENDYLKVFGSAEGFIINADGKLELNNKNGDTVLVFRSAE